MDTNPFTQVTSAQLAWVALTAPDGLERWMAAKHARCDAARGIYCPLCAPPKEAVTR